MTAREKKLSIGVGAVIALIVNYLVIEFFIKNEHRLRDEFARKTTELRTKSLLFDEKELWEKRDAWALAKQPKLINESGAGVALLDLVKEVAKRNTVLLESPAIGTPERKPLYTSMSVNVETKSTKEALSAFLREMQGPEEFIVFENANVQVDSGDKKEMRGKFRVAKWFAPK